MAVTSPTNSDKIALKFTWTGPNRLKEGMYELGGTDVTVINLVFQGAKSSISVHLPQSINPNNQKFPFTVCRTIQNVPRETHPDLLSVTDTCPFSYSIRKKRCNTPNAFIGEL